MKYLRKATEKITRKIEAAKVKMAMNICNVTPKEEKGSSELIVLLVLCAIAVALGILFKDEITTVIKNVITNVGTKINSMMS